MTDAYSPLNFTSVARSHKGCVRDHNEDSFVELPDLGIWAVADGMGGYEAGEIASGMIVEEMDSVGVAVSVQDQRARFLTRLQRANLRIRDHAAKLGLRVAGSTVAAIMVHGTQLSCAWAGDSRIYLFREGRMTALTRDHSEVAQMVAAGQMTEADARVSPRRNVITRAIGISDEVDPELASGVVQPGDRFLICSDGLTEHLTDEEISAALNGSLDLAQLADGLIQATLERGAKDNVTVVVIDCVSHVAEYEAEGTLV